AQGFEVCLIEPGQASRCGARPKSDVLDAQWLQRLHSHGLLIGSFRPLDVERDPARLAAFRDARCKNDEAVIARALEGTWRDEHLFELRQAYELYRTYQMKVTECDAQIEQSLAKLPDRSAGAKLPRKVKKCHRKQNTLRF